MAAILADPDQLLGVLDRYLDAQAGGVTLDYLRGGSLGVGGDQRQVVAAAGLGLSEEDHGERLGAEHTEYHR